MSDLSRDFTDLVDRALAGPLPPEDQAALERHLMETPGAMAYYLRLAEVDALLPDALAGGATTANLVRPAPSTWRRLRTPLALGAVAAAALAALPLVRGDAPAAARLTRTVAARWAGAPASDRISTGELAGGFAELTLDSGVRLLVEGPAKFAVTGKNSARLDFGKVFADVPPGAEGFTLDSPRERIIDHGTRFTTEVARDGTSATVGVVSGEVEVRHADKEVRLYTDYALRREGDTLKSVPFDKSRVATEAPSREFAWDITGLPPGATRALDWDISRLISGPGDFRIMFKWLTGRDAASVRTLRLLRDGHPVATHDLPASTGTLKNTAGNAPVLRLPPEKFHPGATWHLTAELTGKEAPVQGATLTSAGILSFENDLSVHATAQAFIGRWRYTHNGDTYIREFRADGTARLEINGLPYKNLQNVPFTVKDGILTLVTPIEGLREEHMLRDDGTLVFLNQPYRNARRD